MAKPKVKKRGKSWEVKFIGDQRGSYSSIILPTWQEAIEAAIRSGGKDPIDAALGEQFLLSATRALRKMKGTL